MMRLDYVVKPFDRLIKDVDVDALHSLIQSDPAKRLLSLAFEAGDLVRF